MALRVKEKSTTVIFLRHGCTDYPGEQIYDETAGPGLNEEGKREAERLGRWVNGQEIAALLVSPAIRTRETAGPVAKVLGTEPIYKEALRERNFGAWEGLTFQEIEKRYPEGLRRWKEDPVGYTPEGGESILDVQKRVSEFCQWVIQTYPLRHVILVTHMGPIRVAVTQALAMPVRNFKYLCVPTGSATRLNYGETAVNLAYLGVLPGGNQP
ncbi:MAG: histidine phosphatase family protein [Nitrospirae bacterium]|nr:histidine phosphatase family protein [Nitrospirota bacterium]